MLTEGELAHAAANPGFEEPYKVCSGAARALPREPTAARGKAAKCLKCVAGHLGSGTAVGLVYANPTVDPTKLHVLVRVEGAALH